MTNKWTCGAALVLALGAAHVSATTITIDPDSYAAGTALSSISQLVTIDTTGGRPVYAAPLAGAGQSLPDGIVDTGPFGKHVFSREPDLNSEWHAWPDAVGADDDPYDPAEWAKEPNALRITFTQPASYVSLLGLELFPDAGWGGGDDPLRWWIYDSAGLLLFSGYEDTIPGDGSIGLHPELRFNYYFWNLEFSHPDIMTVIVGGESEPTTLDRLTFRTNIPVPEPATLLLMSAGLAGLLCRRRVR